MSVRLLSYGKRCIKFTLRFFFRRVVQKKVGEVKNESIIVNQSTEGIFL